METRKFITFGWIILIEVENSHCCEKYWPSFLWLLNYLNLTSYIYTTYFDLKWDLQSKNILYPINIEHFLWQSYKTAVSSKTLKLEIQIKKMNQNIEE